MAKVLVAPLSWGLGHATRTAAIVRELLLQNNDVIVVAWGRARTFFEREFPSIKVVPLKDYDAPYPGRRFFALKFVLAIPRMLLQLRAEAKNARKIIEKIKPDIILSDGRYNVRHISVPSFIIAHQLRFIAPRAVKPAEFLLEWFNYLHFKRFDVVVVPDFDSARQNLSGRLSHSLRFFDLRKVFYAGPFVDIPPFKRGSFSGIEPANPGCFISISGPEPQRTVFEEIVISQLSDAATVRALEDLTGGKIVVSLGKPEFSSLRKLSTGVFVYDFLKRRRQLHFMRKSSIVVSRSGYTTVMEIAALGKKALLIPTIGQTEQEYLARLYHQRGWFYSVNQYKLDLVRDVRNALSLKGFPFRAEPLENAKNLREFLAAQANLS